MEVPQWQMQERVHLILRTKVFLSNYIGCCSCILSLSVISSCSKVLVRNVTRSVSEFLEYGKRQNKLEDVHNHYCRGEEERSEILL